MGMSHGKINNKREEGRDDRMVGLFGQTVRGNQRKNLADKC